MKSIKEIKNLKGKKVLVRVDFNVPIKNGKVEDDFRIQRALPTIKFLQKSGARIILITHLGKGGESLLSVSKVLNKFIKIKFIPEIIGENTTKMVGVMKNSDVILLENLRNNEGEKACNKIFALNLAKLADIYVNEAFPVSHREDSSIVLLPKLLPSYAGLQLENEVKNLSKTIKSPVHPFLFILGGAKFSTKMPLIKKYLKLADFVFVGGALLDDFLKVEGYEIGKSLVDDENFGIKKLLKNKKLIIPEYVLVKNSLGKFVQKNEKDILKDDTIIDVGEKSVKLLEPIIKKSKLILWNGPLGKYEDGGAGATKEILKMVANSKAESILGGGDTTELIDELKLQNKFSFVSTGGGSTLDFLANGTLPGIKALK
ncbi:MAG: phosphoglycerate kinase [Candidatus Nomurabacteria bacterium]|nr:phosphoglycerate kinase [Candidatus Nomurabacteria bacterium]